ETQGEMHGAPLKSRTEWDESTLVVRSTAVIANRELRLTDRYSVSADGNALTFDEVSQYGTQPEVHQVHTFDRLPASEWGPDTPPKPAEEVYKNIVIMKGVPAPRLRTVMNNLTKWLGVDCSHCHIAGEFEKDDKPAKQTARKMFQMVRSINQENFAGVNPGVTCWTCHRGAAKPQSLPPE
ncbi:MAG TPA: c-type cytochrome, partial [Bryobacteraceae bacterium]